MLLGLRYDGNSARQLAAQAMRKLRDTAYRASIALARTKATFPALDRDAFLSSDFARRLPDDIRAAIAKTINVAANIAFADFENSRRTHSASRVAPYSGPTRSTVPSWAKPPTHRRNATAVHTEQWNQQMQPV